LTNGMNRWHFLYSAFLALTMDLIICHVQRELGTLTALYKFLEQIDPKAGMLRLVMGLGTAAVDRTEGSYPRLVSLDMPQATSCTTIAEKHQFSQRKVEAVDTSGHCVRQMYLDQIEGFLPEYLANILLDHDFDAERSFRERGINRSVRFIACSGIVKNQILMKQIQDNYAVAPERI